jgi:phospholipase/carboxylesterase
VTGGLVILLHGVGARGADLAGLGAQWAAVLPEARFAAPDAPFAFDQGGPGRQWFSVAGVTQVNRPGRVVAGRAAFDDTLRAIIAAHGLTDDPGRVALAGFSQGAIMALDAVASGRWTFGAVVAFSGRLTTPPPLARARTPVLIAHGEIDGVIPVTEAVEARDRLAGAGTDVTLRTWPRVGHAISPEGAALAADFLARSLSPVAGSA